MTSNQNYVSNELTHFVGAKIKLATPNETREARYTLLVKILREGTLISKGGSGALVIKPFNKFTDNDVIAPEGVCFCDIPTESLAIHMGKYGEFGLAFLKSFLLQEGANPVFYVASNAKLRLVTLDGKRAVFSTEGRAEYFNRRFSEFYDAMMETKRFLYDQRNDTPDAQRVLTTLEQAENFLSSLFVYFKSFDASKAEDDADNFYMEREWRLRLNLKFKAEDVCRIILPKAFVARFKNDFPTFRGAEEEISAEVTSIRR